MTDDDNSFSRYLEQEEHRKKLAAELRIATKAKLFDALNSAGIASVTVSFDGQGDSGQIEEIAALSCDNKPKHLPADRISFQITKFDGTGTEERTDPLANVIEHLCYELLEEEHAGWEVNEGAFGELLFDAAKHTLTLTFNFRISDVETSIETY